MLGRPSLDEILAYRSHIDQALLRALPRLSPAALKLVELGLQHEQQHQELMLMDMLATLAENPLAHAAWPSEPTSTADTPLVLGGSAMPGGVAEIGEGGSGFAFDCERPRHRVLINPHELSDRPVSNGEWLRFMTEGGYDEPGLWLSDGWEWVRREAVEAPLYWRDHGGWKSFGLDGLHPVDPAEPVCHISYYEADAFARWAGARLPTEAEWEIAASGLDPRSGNQLDEAGPVRPRPAGAGRGGFEGQPRLRQMFGDVWEWTMSAFLPYPGFRPGDGVVGEYNGKFMCNQFVLRGGSCATPRGHVRATYRNFFYPHQRWQFSGLRLARDLPA
jgi:ergothioneine biosynthesis protein EgtB